MIVTYDLEEFWPYITMSEFTEGYKQLSYGTMEIPKDLFDRYNAAQKEFEEVSELVNKAMDK